MPGAAPDRGTKDLFHATSVAPSVASVLPHLFRLRWAAAAVAVAVILVAAGAWWYGAPQESVPALDVPSAAGLNYAFPHTVSGGWVGTRWLRSGGPWETSSPAFAADLDFIHTHGLGRVVRLFVGLDQTMVWDPNAGFDGFQEDTLQHFARALDMLDARGMRAVVVVFDQEETASPGNFHFEALDGHHEIMRRNYLVGLSEFMRRFGERPTVIGWDLFNEAYNSLGVDGHLPSPPHADPVSPNYSDTVVHTWLADMYRTARTAAPAARFTVSDSTELYWNPSPDLAKYDDVVDFYDIHVYDDHPLYPGWGAELHKPYIVGEAGASTAGAHEDNQALNSQAVSYLLEHAGAAGVSLVLAQGQTFSADRTTLTPTGSAVASFLSSGSRVSGEAQRRNPVDAAVYLIVSAARRIKRGLGL